MQNERGHHLRNRSFSGSLVPVDVKPDSIIDRGWVHGSLTASFYRRLVESECGDSLGENLGLYDNQLASLFQCTFGPNFLDNFHKSLVWHCY